MESSTEKGIDSVSQLGMRSKGKRIAKWIIAAIVVVGLGVATRSAVKQWNAQRDLALQRVEQLREELNREPAAAERMALQRELEIALSQVPRLDGLDRLKLGWATVLYALGLIPGGMVLRESTRALGYRVSFAHAIAAQTVGHLGKYVPGKAMVVVIRAGRLSGVGVPVMAGTVAVFLETLLMMAVGAALSGVLIFALPVPRWIAWAALLGGIAATLPTFPALLRRVVARVGTRPDQEVQQRLPEQAGRGRFAALGHDWRFFLLGWCFQLAAWGLIGSSFALIVASVPGAGQTVSAGVYWSASVAAIALAMVVGFASLLPGGAGVRELTLAVILAPVVGQSQALLAAILARVVFIVVEVVAAFGVSAFHRVGFATDVSDASESLPVGGELQEGESFGDSANPGGT